MAVGALSFYSISFRASYANGTSASEREHTTEILVRLVLHDFEWYVRLCVRSAWFATNVRGLKQPPPHRALQISYKRRAPRAQDQIRPDPLVSPPGANAVSLDQLLVYAAVVAVPGLKTRRRQQVGTPCNVAAVAVQFGGQTRPPPPPCISDPVRRLNAANDHPANAATRLQKTCVIVWPLPVLLPHPCGHVPVPGHTAAASSAATALAVALHVPWPLHQPARKEQATNMSHADESWRHHLTTSQRFLRQASRRRQPKTRTITRLSSLSGTSSQTKWQNS